MRLSALGNVNKGGYMSGANSLVHMKYQSSILNPFAHMNFSIKMKKVAAKMLAKRNVKKYKLKTNKAARKRFIVIGRIQDKKFMYKSSNARHLMRNKSRANRLGKRGMKIFDTPGNIKYVKKLMPYYKKTAR